MNRPHRLALALVALAIVSPAIAAGQQDAAKTTTKPAATKPDTAKPAPKNGAAKAPAELYATFVTSEGKIGARLFPEQKPNSVKNFVDLAEGKKEWTDPRTGQRTTKPIYDGTVFHRVIPGFMIQGGDPLGKGVGGPGYAIPDEIQDGERFFDKPCQLAYANSGPNTNGSQFFITEVATPHLNATKCPGRSPSGVCGYVRFGEGVCGCDLVGRIARLGNSKVVLQKVIISTTRPTCQ